MCFTEDGPHRPLCPASVMLLRRHRIPPLGLAPREVVDKDDQEGTEEAREAVAEARLRRLGVPPAVEVGVRAVLALGRVHQRRGAGCVWGVGGVRG